MRTLVRLVVAVAMVFGAVGVATNAGAQTTKSLTVTPATGLSDGDTVTLHGTGFQPLATVYYCEGVVDSSPDPSDCGTSYLTTEADQSGEFSQSFQVERFLSSASHGEIDCAQPDAACGVGADDLFTSNGGAVITPIAFTSQPPVEFEINGTVTDPDGNPVEGVDVWAYKNSDGFAPTFQTVTGSDGKYTLADVERNVEYRLRFGPPSGSGFAPEWYNNQFNRRAAAFVELGFRVPTATLDAQLATSGGIAGTVTDAAGAPLAGVRVWAYAPWDTWVGSYAATTGANGSYEIDGVWPASNYRVRFAPPTESGLAYEWFDNQPTAATAARFEVTSGVIGSNVDASLAPPAAP
jgi:hypothetical protein